MIAYLGQPFFDWSVEDRCVPKTTLCEQAHQFAVLPMLIQCPVGGGIRAIAWDKGEMA